MPTDLGITWRSTIASAIATEEQKQKPLKEAVEKLENKLVFEAYCKYNFNQTIAAKKIGINRGTFRKILKRAFTEDS